MWILIDLAIALAALAVLAVLVLSLWRRVKALSRLVAEAGETVGSATAALEAAQAAGPLGAPGERPVGVPRSSGVQPGDSRRSAAGRPSRRSLTVSSPRRGARR